MDRAVSKNAVEKFARKAGSRNSAGRRQARNIAEVGVIFCDEAADISSPLEALQHGLTAADGIDILIGPEGGFAEEERALLLRQPLTLRLSLGPRILRADTAAVAALALVQAARGDWTGPGASA